MPAQLGNVIETCCTEFSYAARCGSGRGSKALDGVSLRIGKGEYVAIAGGNGSGKTTFARLLNALLLPTGGTVCITGADTSDKEQLWEVRRVVGMVFQDPDSQIVGTTVAEDVAFGPSNLGLEPEKMRMRVRQALRDVGMAEHADAAPHLLSGGQKQRVSVAGVLAMEPECVILDEATSMLDPMAREEIMCVLRRFNREEGLTVIHITHDMEEAALADRVIVLDAGKVALDGKPHEVFSRISRLRALGLDAPQLSELFDLLRGEGFDLPSGILDVDEAEVILTRWLAGRGYAFHTS